ncbi:hydantoinase/oxoprolinase family protein [Marinibaculum pumilum]|uniref:Hydantoinase/oxoprolinase family protein n=1 Tax=Marinibaculum pumilum TaxID=1766165 RepID=A0ABV7KZ23_9PROT
MTARGLVVGVDVGGTFTDIFVLGEAAGTAQVAKVPSTRPDQSVGIRAGIAERVDQLGRVATIVHGTTVGTNALLERKGARTGLITTAGFRDVLEMRRRDRPQTWGLWGSFEPVVPRDLRREVAERVLADGTVLQPVDPDEVQAAARALLADGVEAVCIFFVNGYANPANEAAAAAAVRAVWPNDCVTAATEILPEIREFERASTAALNAYLQPPVGSYLARLGEGLESGGFDGRLLIVQSNGGVMSAETARATPVKTALSGPAAGVIAAAEIARVAGFPNVITCDMGGTSFDVSLIAEGRSAVSPQTSIDFGMVIRSPMIEITTIGAGGGSIARIDRGGLLQVGPESAGSDPGPVAYGRGNDRPTVTDANIVLGRINAERPIGGGSARLDVEAARAAILEHVGRPLGMDAEAAAEAIIRVANAKMAAAIRLVSVERGHDPKRFVAMPFGGGGALHAGALIEEVGLARALVPRFPGVTSALGCVIADMRFDKVATVNRLLDGLDAQALAAPVRELEAEGRDLVGGAGVTLAGIESRVELDMHYLGQTHTVAVQVPLQPDAADLGLGEAAVRGAFEGAYRRAYGKVLQGLGIRILNVRVTVVGQRPKFDLAVLAPGSDARIEAALLGERQVHAGGRGQTAKVWDRLALPVGARIEGPALLEQPDTTIFVDPGLAAEVDRYGNLVIARQSELE